jgi:hypothetical protein
MTAVGMNLICCQRSVPLILLLVLVAFLPRPGAGAPAREPIEVKIVVISSGAGPDEVSFVYAAPAKEKKARQALEARARQDFQALAAAFGQAAKVKVSTEAVAEGVPATTSAEGKLQRLVNRPAGWLNIGPFLKLFSRYDRLSLTFFVAPPFQFRGPAGPFDDPSMAMTLDTGGNAFTYEVRLKHTEGQGAAALPSFDAPAGGLARLGKAAYLVVGLMAVAAGVAVYSILQYWLGRKAELR